MTIENYSSVFSDETGDKKGIKSETIRTMGVITCNRSVINYFDDGVAKQGIVYNILTTFPAYSAQERTKASLIIARGEYYKVVGVVHDGARGHYRSTAIKSNKDRLRHDNYVDI